MRLRCSFGPRPSQHGCRGCSSKWNQVDDVVVQSEEGLARTRGDEHLYNAVASLIATVLQIHTSIRQEEDPSHLDAS